VVCAGSDLRRQLTVRLLSLIDVGAVGPPWAGNDYT